MCLNIFIIWSSYALHLSPDPLRYSVAILYSVLHLRICEIIVEQSCSWDSMMFIKCKIFVNLFATDNTEKTKVLMKKSRRSLF